MPTPRTSATGTTNPNSVSTNGSSLNITSGTTIDGNSSDLVALVGSDIATKNNLSVGSTFTAYSKTITVSGIFKTDNKFQDSGIIMPLATVQSLTSQTGSVSSVTAKVNSSDNVDAVVTSLKSSLGDKADIVSEAQQAADSVSSLESISSIALMGVIGATIAGAIIVLIAMIMIVRERRREIGVIKAIGGSDKKVISQFITEALTLTVIGSIIGLSLGVIVKQPGMMGRGMEQISNSLTQITSSVTPQTFAMAIGITFVIAIVGSATPAWFIAKIRPAEVLRSE
jgi:putative ABC transport system permease protein